MMVRFYSYLSVVFSACSYSKFIIIIIAITLGFEMDQYSVNEADSFVRICIIMTNPPSNEDLVFEVITEYTSIRGTAGDD